MRTRTAIAAAQARSIALGRPTTGTDFCHERLASWPPERLDPPPLVTGQSLIDLGHRPGPHFKRALAAARAAQLDGKISTAAEAIELARSILANPLDRN